MENKVFIYKEKNRKEGIQKILFSIRAGLLVRVKEYPFICIKPNFLSSRRSLASSSPETIIELIKWLRNEYDGKIIVAEGSPNSEELLQKLRLHDVFKKYSVTFFNPTLQEKNWLHFSGIDQMHFPVDIRYSKTLAPSFKISLTTPKMHGNAGMSLSLKNMMGLLHPNDKKLMHGLSPAVPSKIRAFLSSHPWERDTQSGFIVSNLYGMYFRTIGKNIVSKEFIRALLGNYHVLGYNLYQLSKNFYPEMSFIDGYEVMEGEGPWFGTSKKLHIFVGSFNFVLADSAMAQIMGVNPHDIEYLYYLLNYSKYRIKANSRSIQQINILKTHCYSHSYFSIQKNWLEDSQHKIIMKKIKQSK